SSYAEGAETAKKLRKSDLPGRKCVTELLSAGSSYAEGAETAKKLRKSDLRRRKCVTGGA
ncbi:hypothetical protein, partial [Emergencia timonensis]|uniref:hypothetical protein n=1 Tax=Emergencia timonensis TaxID=1776384 RepID=UPI00399AD02D